jgi:hypothetical protein
MPYQLEVYCENNPDDPSGTFTFRSGDIEQATQVAGDLVKRNPCDYGALYLAVSGDGPRCYLGAVTVDGEIVTLILPPGNNVPLVLTAAGLKTAAA